MRIAIIDSGVDLCHERLKNAKISGIGFAVKNHMVIQTGDYRDQVGHGTAIAAIIHKHFPEAEIHCVKVFSDTMFIREEALYKALDYCIAKNYPVINLSLGVNVDPPKEELVALCKKAYENNIALICAADNRPAHPAYPASLPYVIGVGSGAGIKKSTEYGVSPGSAIDFLAKGTIQRVAWKEGVFKVIQGTSYACAHFSGIVAKAHADTSVQSLEQLKTILREGANPRVKPFIHYQEEKSMDYVVSNNDLDRHGEQLFVNRQKLSWLKNVAIFPVSNKELSIFYKFPELFDINLTYFIDYQKAYTNVFFEKNEKTPVLNALPSQEQWQHIDTLVVGYYLDEMFEANIHFGNALIESVLEQNKNIYYFDPRLDDIIEKLKEGKTYTGITYRPQVNQETFGSVKMFRYLPEVKAPVVAVIGTSSKQGKFSAQIVMKKILNEEGYKVGFLSTEPQGELFGASAVFPYGYMSTVKLDITYWHEMIEWTMKGMQQYNSPHIFITGMQGGLVPRSMSQPSSGLMEMQSLTFLTAVKPDALICAVNPDDSSEIIQKTLDAARIYTDAEVLFLILNPYRRTDEQGEVHFRKLNIVEYCTERERLIQALNRPVIDIMNDKNADFILSSIEDYFSK